MRTSTTPDVLVIGGGVIGVSCALELRRRGADVHLVERESTVGAACSYGSAGLISPHHATPIASPAMMRQGVRSMFRSMFDPASPFALKMRPAVIPWLFRYLMASTRVRAEKSAAVMRALTARSLAIHIEYISQGIETSLKQRGSLSVYGSAAGLAAGQREARAHGTSAEIFPPARLRTLDVRFGPAIAGAIHIVEDAHCDSHQFATAVGEAAREAGARVDTNVEIRRLVAAGGRITRVESTAGVIQPKEVVLAGGVWSGRLARQAGAYVPVAGGKGYHIDVPLAATDPDLPIYIEDAKVLAVPLAGRLRIAGMFELSGLDATVRAARLRAMRDLAERTLDGLADRPALETWAGIRPCTPDGVPVIGRPAAVANLTVATGHAMKGLALAPLTGRLVAEQLSGEPSSVESAALSPDRFQRLVHLLTRHLPRRSRQPAAA
jgi:D-amino-acid dehydrogenase